MEIREMLDKKTLAKLAVASMDREMILQRRKARKDAKKAARATGNYRGCGWNHRVPGAEKLEGLNKPRGTANPAKGRWKMPKEWQDEREVPYIKIRGYYVRNGSRCPNVGPVKAGECPSIEPPKREKTIERMWRGLSWNDMVQHGIREER